MSGSERGEGVNVSSGDLQRWSANPAVWFKEFVCCVLDWRVESLAGFFMGKPWGDIGTAFILGCVSRGVLEHEDKAITTETVSDFVEMVKRQPVALSVEDIWVRSRFEMMLLSQPNASSSLSEFEAFVADAALLHCVLVSSRDAEDVLRFADEMLVEAGEELLRLRKENEGFLSEVIRGEHENPA